MTWHTQLGERVIRGAEARLLRAALARAVGVAETRLEFPDLRCEYGVRIFDEMSPGSQLAILAEVANALFCNTECCPKLTAVKESTVAILYLAIVEMVEYELECPFDVTWRRMIVEAMRESESFEEIPAEDCDCMDEWGFVIECLSDMILWDDDFHDSEDVLDADPATVRPIREMMGIDNDYYCDIPPDPKEADILAIRQKLTTLYSE